MPETNRKNLREVKIAEAHLRLMILLQNEKLRGLINWASILDNSANSPNGGIEDWLREEANLYAFVANNPLSWVDALGLKRKFTASEKKKIDDMLQAIKQCAKASGDNDVISAIDALDLKGIFDDADVKADPSRKDDSETTFGFYWLESDTVLAKDFFTEDGPWNDKTRAEVLIHEGWHAWKKKVDEDSAYKFGEKKCDNLWDCTKKKLGIK